MSVRRRRARLRPFPVSEIVMKKLLALVGASALAVLTAIPAAAKTDPKAGAKKEVAQPHWQHTYTAALEEAKERGCVIFATFHSEH